MGPGALEFHTGPLDYHRKQNSAEIVNYLSPGGTPNSDSVAVWVNHVASPEMLAMSRAYHVVGLIWWKESTGAQHEALEIQFAGGAQNKTTAWLLVERGGVTARTPSPSSTTNSSTASLNRSADNSGQISSQRTANDTVVVSSISPISGTPSTYKQLAEFTMLPNSDNLLTLCDLAALLRAVSESRPEYDILNSNCYWFAGMIIGAIQRVHPGHVVFEDLGISPGHLACFSITTNKDIKEGLTKVMPQWDIFKFQYQSTKTTQEVKQEVEAQIARETARADHEAKGRRVAEARADHEAEARRASAEAYQAEKLALIQQHKAEIRDLKLKLSLAKSSS
ncbi:hypothetical protein HWV62_17842 [Athelia sp. TMB]|nr:hypothetical protein HWV62_17842 [Athelia sp. TMB]